jgi:hypothetical protein
METITCACPHCRAASLAVIDEYWDEPRPSDDDWVEIEGAWHCPDCSDYTLDHDGEVVCACQIGKLGLQEIRDDHVAHLTVARDKYGRTWVYHWEDPTTTLPRPDPQYWESE